MSIWCSWETIGWDDEGQAVGGMVIDMDGIREPDPHWNHGQIRAYAEGWSNHYPDETVETPASVGVASIPVWCVPGHRDEYNEDLGPRLRLDIAAQDAPNYWTKDENGDPTRRSFYDAVVLDEAAVRALRDHLDQWLTRPKAQPVQADSTLR